MRINVFRAQRSQVYSTNFRLRLQKSRAESHLEARISLEAGYEAQLIRPCVDSSDLTSKRFLSTRNIIYVTNEQKNVGIIWLIRLLDLHGKPGKIIASRTDFF